MYQWVGVFVVVAIFFLVIILPPSLVALEPDTGWPLAYPYYSTTGGSVISVGSSCAPSLDFGNIRALSNEFFPQDPLWNNPKYLSNLAWAFGQLVMQDVYVPVTNSSQPVDVLLTTYPGTNMTMDLLTTTASNIATQCFTILNGATPLLDMDWLYVLPGARTGAVRGRLALSQGGYLPIEGNGQFLQAVANENTVVAALTTLFALEHNRWAETLALAHPGWNNDQLFWKARSYMIQIYQGIIWQEWVPALFGYVPALPEVRPGTPEPTQEFALIASQFFRTFVANVTYLASPGNATALALRTQTLTTALYQGWATSAAAFDRIIDITLTRNAQTNRDYMSMYMVWERQLGLGSLASIQQAYGMTGIPVNGSAPIYSSPSLPEFFAERLTGPNTTVAVAPTMSWVVMEQLQRSAR